MSSVVLHGLGSSPNAESEEEAERIIRVQLAAVHFVGDVDA
jgi:hypothetical protein